MNGDAPNNSKVIHLVAFTVCIGAIVCIGTQAFCYINKIPDMNNALSGAFIHIADTLIGALIGMLVNTRPQQQRPEDGEKLPVEVDQPINKPIPVVPTQTPIQPIAKINPPAVPVANQPLQPPAKTP